jgi:hypothetical protein
MTWRALRNKDGHILKCFCPQVPTIILHRELEIMSHMRLFSSVLDSVEGMLLPLIIIPWCWTLAANEDRIVERPRSRRRRASPKEANRISKSIFPAGYPAPFFRCAHTTGGNTIDDGLVGNQNRIGSAETRRRDTLGSKLHVRGLWSCRHAGSTAPVAVIRGRYILNLNMRKAH